MVEAAVESLTSANLHTAAAYRASRPPVCGVALLRGTHIIGKEGDPEQNGGAQKGGGRQHEAVDESFLHRAFQRGLDAPGRSVPSQDIAGCDERLH